MSSDHTHSFPGSDVLITNSLGMCVIIVLESNTWALQTQNFVVGKLECYAMVHSIPHAIASDMHHVVCIHTTT